MVTPSPLNASLVAVMRLIWLILVTLAAVGALPLRCYNEVRPPACYQVSGSKCSKLNQHTRSGKEFEKWKPQPWHQLDHILGDIPDRQSPVDDKIQDGIHSSVHHKASQGYPQKDRTAGTIKRSLQARQTDSGRDAEYYHERANKYRREFLQNKSLKDARARGEGTEQELKYYQDLKSDFNTSRRLKYEPKSKSRSAASTFSREYVDYLHDRHREFIKMKRETDQGLLTKLKNGDGSVPKGLREQYESLLKDSREYWRWYDLQRRSRPKEYSSEAKAVMDANRKRYREYMRRYKITPTDRAEAARLRAGQGTPEELKAFEALWNSYKAYLKASSSYRKSSGKVKVEISEGMLGTLEKLEATREAMNQWATKYKNNKALRDRLEARQGTEAELAEYDKVKQGALEHNRIYLQGYKKTRRAGLNDDVADKDQKLKLELTSGGKPRWFRANINTRRRMKHNGKVSPKNDEGPGGPDVGNLSDKDDESQSDEGNTNRSPENDQTQDQPNGSRTKTGTSDSESTGQADSGNTQLPPLQSSNRQPRGGAASSLDMSSRTPSGLGWPSAVGEALKKISSSTAVPDTLARMAVLGSKVRDSIVPLY